MSKLIYMAALEAINNGNYAEDASLVAAVEQGDESLLSSYKTSMMLASNELSLESGESDVMDQAAFDAALTASAAVGLRDKSKLYKGLDEESNRQGYGVNLESDQRFALENFDGHAVNVFQAATFAYNVEAATQDSFSEAFFPTVIGDINTAGVAVSLRRTEVITDFLRSNDKSDAKKFNRKSLISALSDQDGVLAGDHLKLVPVVGSGFDAQLNVDITTKVKYDATGEMVDTAPYRVGKILNVIGAAQSSMLLSKGVMDNSDTLASSVPVEYIHFSTSEAGKFIKVPVSHLDGAIYLAGTRGDSKDLVLSAKTQLVVNFSEVVVHGGDIAAISALPANSKAVFDITLLGNGNAVDGELLFNVPQLEFVGARNATGGVIPETDATYTAIKTEAEALVAVGVDLGARLTNSNIRRNGIHLTSRNRTEILPVKTLTPIYTDSPISGQNIGDHDGSFLTDLLSVAGILSNFSAVRTLSGFATFMKGQAGVAAGDVQTGTIGQGYVTPFYKESEFVLTDYVDSTRGQDRQSDVAATVINNIATDVAEMLSISGYNNYAKYVRRAEKINVTIGTYPALAAFLGSSIDLGNGIEANVVSTDNTEINGKVYVTVAGVGAKTNEVTPDKFGVRLFVPSLVSSTDVTENGASKSKMVVNPLFLHEVVCPILLKYNVSGLTSVMGKVARNSRTVQ